MDKSYLVRPARLEDAEGIADVVVQDWFAALTSGFYQQKRQQVYAFLKLLERTNSQSLYVSTEPYNRITGYGAVHWLPRGCGKQQYGYVFEFFVSPFAINRRTAQELVSAIRREAAVRNCEQLIAVIPEAAGQQEEAQLPRCAAGEAERAAAGVCLDLLKQLPRLPEIRLGQIAETARQQQPSYRSIWSLAD